MLIKFEVNIELPVILLFCLPKRQEDVSDTVRGEHRLAQDAHDLKHGSANLEVVLDNGSEAVGDDGNVNLYADCILRLSPEPLDSEVLLDPFEEKFNLPPIFIQQGDFLGFEEEVVRVVNKAAVEFRRIVDYPSDDAGILLLILCLRKSDTLVFEHIVFAFEQTFAIDNLVCRLALLPDDEECPKDMNLVEPGEVEVASVKHIAGQSLVCEPVHRVDIVNLGIGNPVEYGNLSGDVNLCVNLDARLGAPELCPSEHGHAEVDGCRVDGVEPAMQLKLLNDSLGLGNSHHVEGKLLEDSVVSKVVRLGKHLPVDGPTAKAEKYGLLCMGNSDVGKFSEARTACKLAKHEDQQVVPVRHGPAFGPIFVLGDNAPELPLREEAGNLCENVCSNVHFCSDFESDAKVRISRFGQESVFRKCCA